VKLRVDGNGFLTEAPLNEFGEALRRIDQGRLGRRHGFTGVEAPWWPHTTLSLLRK